MREHIQNKMKEQVNANHQRVLQMTMDSQQKIDAKMSELDEKIKIIMMMLGLEYFKN